EVVETDEVDALFRAPQHDYTRMLLDAVPRVAGGHMQAPALAEPKEGPPVLAADDVRVSFPMRVEGGLFGKVKQLRAGDGVSVALRGGETLGIVGESGCGKSTLARAVAQLVPRTAGVVTFLGRGLTPRDQDAIRNARADLQMVFQDPLASLDPRMSIGRSIA